MILWVIFASMTAAAIFAVLWPLGRNLRAARGGSDLNVYKDQLQEIDSDRAAGLIGEAEAEAARLEVSRRLLAAADAPAAAAAAARQTPRWRRARGDRGFDHFAVRRAGPLCRARLAEHSGRAGAWPASRQRRAKTADSRSPSLVSQVEAHLARNPNDGAGWEVIAPVYMRLGRYDDAVEASRKSLALNGETATREADLGEALAAAAERRRDRGGQGGVRSRRRARSARTEGPLFSRPRGRAGRQKR